MFKKAIFFYAWYLRLTGYIAIVNPFSVVCHVLPEYIPVSPRLKAHEEAHFAQIRRDGKLAFIAKYLFYMLKYGYHKNPYEIEARKAERAI